MKSLRLFQLWKVVALCFFVGLILLLWNRGRVPQWISETLIASLKQNIPEPIQIKTLSVESRWLDLLRGSLGTLKGSLLWDSIEVTMDGPLYLRSASEAAADLSMTLTIHQKKSPPSESITLKTSLSAQLNPDEKKLLAATFKIQGESAALPSLQCDLQGLTIEGTWIGAENIINGTLTLTSLTLGDVAINKALSLQNLKVTFNGNDKQITADGSIASGELLKDALYVTLPLADAPFSFVLSRSDAATEGALFIHWPDSKSVHISLKHIQGQKILPLTVSLPSFSLTKAFQTLKKIPEIQPLPAFISKGRLSASAQIDLTPNTSPLWSLKTAAAQISNLAVHLTGSGFHSSGIHAQVKWFDQKEVRAQTTLSAENLQYKKLRARIHPLEFSFLEKEQEKLIRSTQPRITSDSFTLEMTPFTGTWKAQDSGIPWIQLHTALSMEPTDMSALARKLCKNDHSLPPAKMTISFDDVLLDQEAIETKGQITFNLFKGHVILSDPKIFDPFSKVPETQLNIDWNELRLEEVGRWLNFGKMEGILKGHLHDLTLQELLPTQYDFRMEVSPSQGEQVVFSPAAMKNVVNLFAGENVEKSLPGVADWLAFGWPSRIFGGYNIEYAGLSLYSSEGSILLETLDPEDVLMREKKHFILYGPRFKMPLRSARYPLVLDAPAMANFVRHMKRQLEALKASATEEVPHEQTSPPIDPECR